MMLTPTAPQPTIAHNQPLPLEFESPGSARYIKTAPQMDKVKSPALNTGKAPTDSESITSRAASQPRRTVTTAFNCGAARSLKTQQRTDNYVEVDVISRRIQSPDEQAHLTG